LKNKKRIDKLKLYNESAELCDAPEPSNIVWENLDVSPI